MDKCKTGLGYNAVLPPYTGNFMPPKPDLVYPSLDDFVDVNKFVFEKPTVETNEPKTARNENGALIIEDWVSSKRPIKNVIKNAYSTARRPCNKITAANNSNFTKKVNTVKRTRVNTARPKVVLSVVKGNKGNVVKASACWVWRSKHKVLDHVSKNNGASMSFKRFDYIDVQGRSNGCSRHMIGNRSYLTDYEEINRGFVAFGGNSKGGKITGKDLRVKVIRCDNGTEFKNRVMNQFYEMKGIKREFSVSRTPQQKGVAERKNKTLIEAARTMLADSKLQTTFWAKAVNTACYVQNRVLVIKPHNKTPYELFLGRKHALSFMRPFGCPVTILNTIDLLGSRPNWLFDIDALTKYMNHKLVVAENQSNGNACKARVETVPGKDYILLSLWTQDLLFSSSSKDSPDAGFKPSGEEEKKDVEDPWNEDSEVPSIEELRVNQEKDANVNITNNINVVSLIVNAAGIEDNVIDENVVYGCVDDLNMPELEDYCRFSDAEDDNIRTDMNNLDTYFQVSPVPTTRIHKDHPLNQVIGDLQSTTQTRQMTKNLEEYGTQAG
ncbi:ribonuclease H-like domain-containing protein [Tanacetum coccineum]